MEDTDAGATELKTRRNGQLMSCEPCRRSKQRCDHRRPQCMRCQKRGQAAQCHYHPAPMTRGPRMSAAGIVKTSSSSSRKRDLHQTHTSPRDIIQQAALDRGTSLVSMDDVISPLIESTINEHGPTRTYTAITRTGIATPPFAPSAALLKEGESILETLRDSPKTLGNLVSSWYNKFETIPCGLLVKICWTVTQDVLVQSLLDESTLVDLSLQSRSMFEYTSQRQEWPYSPANGAIARALSVDGVRWDVVGVYFGIVGNAIGSVDGADNIDFTYEKWGPSRKAAMERVLQACVQCYNFCEHVGQMNDLTMWNLINATMLATWCYGDDSFQAWRLMGDLASLVSALGFNRDSNDAKTTPTYLLELRKRGVEWCHELDKGLATFVGRPPRLYRRHYDLGAPLDLSDEVLFGTPTNLQSAIKELDSEGWNKKGLMYPASRFRVQHKLIAVREEALELVLSSSAEDVSLKSQQLLHKSAAIWESIPPHMRYIPAFWDTKTPHTVALLIYLRLENLYTEFLLQKMIVYQDLTSRRALIQTSHQILSIVLSVLNRKLIAASCKMDLEWTMVNYAMPCASILILELLRQSEQPDQPAIINRSRIIQDISVLISCDWLIEPDQMNFELCKRAQSLFSRSLDRILNHVPTQPAAPATRQQPRNLDSGITDGSAQDNQLVHIDDAEWLAWLETCDLSVDPWLDIFADANQDFAGNQQLDMSQSV